MKKACLSILACLVFLSGIASGNEPSVKPESMDTNVDYSIFQSIIGYPHHLGDIREKEIVLIAFRIEEGGNIHLEESNTSNDDLLNYVIAQIRNAHLSVEELGAKKHYLKFTFVSR